MIKMCMLIVRVIFYIWIRKCGTLLDTRWKWCWIPVWKSLIYGTWYCSHVALCAGNAVLERCAGFTMLLGCSYGRCQWTGVETSEQTPWCSTLLHPYAPQFCVHPRSKIPQRGPGFLCWRQATYCAGMHLSHNYKQSKSAYNRIAYTDFLNSGVLCCIPHWPSSIAVINAVFQVRNCCKHMTIYIPYYIESLLCIL